MKPFVPLLMAALLSAAGMGVAAEPLPRRSAERAAPEKQAIEAPLESREIRKLLRETFDDDTLGLFFGVLRSALEGSLMGMDGGDRTDRSERAERAKREELERRLDQKLDKLSRELPARVAPLVRDALDQAEREVKRAVRESLDETRTPGGPR